MSARRRTRPPSPGFHAFCYTVPNDGSGAGTFVIAGSGEAPEGPGPYRDRIIRRGDTSPDAMREKARYVLGAMESRMAALGFGWRDATAAQVYTIHEIHGLFGPEIAARGADPDGIQWSWARPPVEGLALRDGCARPVHGARHGLTGPEAGLLDPASHEKIPLFLLFVPEAP